MKKIFSEIIFDNNGINLFKIKRSKNRLNFIKNIPPKQSPLYVIDLRKYSLGRLLEEPFNYESKKVKYFKPKNLIDLYNFSKKKIIYAHGPINCTFKTLFIFILLKVFNFKLIFIDNFGFYLNISDSDIKKNYKYKLLTFKNIFFRFFALINIIPKISLCFMASSNSIKKINGSFSKRFDKLFTFIEISYYQKIKRINSIYYNEIIYNKNKITQSYIIFIDSGFSHPDITRYGFKIKNEKEYFINLFQVLKKIQKNYCKKIIFCKHPKSPISAENLKFIKKNFILAEYKEEYVWKADFVMFTGGSSLVNKCLILKKPFIFLLSKYQSEYSYSLIKSLERIIKVNKIILEKFNISRFKLLLNNKINYKHFIRCNLIYKENIKSEKIIQKTLFNEEK